MQSYPATIRRSRTVCRGACPARSGASAGFSLTEMLVVLVIVGILVLLAIPNLQSVIGRAKSTEARLQLKYLWTLQRAYFFEHDRYAAAFAEVGYDAPRTLEEGGTARYRIRIIRADAAHFLARATALFDGDGDGIREIWEVNEDGVVRKVRGD